MNNVLSFPTPTLLFKEVCKGKRLERLRLLLWRPFTVCKCSDGSYNVKLIPFDQFQSLIVDSNAILRSWLFNLNSKIAIAFCQGKPDFGIRSECMNAENLCTTYYLVLLFSMWTPALRCGVYLFTCLCLTLCALHRRSLLCSLQFGWLWMSCPF